MFIPLTALVFSFAVVDNLSSNNQNMISYHSVDYYYDEDISLYKFRDNIFPSGEYNIEPVINNSPDILGRFMSFHFGYAMTANFSDENGNSYNFTIEFADLYFEVVASTNSSTGYYLNSEIDIYNGFYVDNEYVPLNGFNLVPIYNSELLITAVPMDVEHDFTELTYNYVSSQSLYRNHVEYHFAQFEIDEAIFNYSSMYITPNMSFMYLEEDFYSIVESTNSDAYSTGYTDGYEDGGENGYRDGYNDGWYNGFDEGLTYSDGTITEIFANILQVGMLPVNLFLSMMNFEVFGINIGAIVSGLLTLCLTIIIIRMIKGSSSGGGSQ